MQGSLGYVIWTACYLAVLIGLSAYGIHRYFIIYLFLKNRKRASVPASQFRELPKVTVQLPIFNEVYVVERLLRSVSELDYPRGNRFLREGTAGARVRCSADTPRGPDRLQGRCARSRARVGFR